MTEQALPKVVSTDEAEELANAVQDDLTGYAQEFPGSSLRDIARQSYDAIMYHLGHPTETDAISRR